MFFTESILEIRVPGLELPVLLAAEVLDPIRINYQDGPVVNYDHHKLRAQAKLKSDRCLAF
jgi:hypothetical protein